MEARAGEHVIFRGSTLLLAAIGVQVVLFIVARRDVPADDALGYAETAYWMTADPAFFAHPSAHPFVMRVGITLPLAALFATFGVSAWTVNLPCLLATITILLVVYYAAPSDRAKRIGLGLATTSTAFLLYGTELNADLLCGAATAVSLLLLVRGRLAAAVAVWFCAFLVKETTVWFAPAWLYVLVLDLRSLGWRATARRFAPAIVVGAVLAATYLGICAVVWGNPLARVAGINALAGEHPWSPHAQSSAWWMHRLVWGPPLAYLATFGVALLLASFGARRITGANRVWLVALVSYLLFHWFGSASTLDYVPLPLAQRRMLMEVLPCVLVAATLASEHLAWRRWRIALVGLAVLLPFAWTLQRAVRRARPETALLARIRADVERTQGPIVIVCPDFRCIATVPFALGYRVPSNVQTASIVDFARAPLPAHARVRVVVKRVRPRIAMFSDLATARATAEAIDALELPRLYWHRDLRLYDAGDGARLHAALALLR